jgi:hypothetical protein
MIDWLLSVSVGSSQKITLSLGSYPAPPQFSASAVANQPFVMVMMLLETAFVVLLPVLFLTY